MGPAPYCVPAQNKKGHGHAMLCVPHAPYVTEESWIDRYGCKYVVHGDDISTDADGRDCYEGVKKAGRFLVCKRTEGISTTGELIHEFI